MVMIGSSGRAWLMNEVGVDVSMRRARFATGRWYRETPPPASCNVTYDMASISEWPVHSIRRSNRVVGCRCWVVAGVAGAGMMVCDISVRPEMKLTVLTDQLYTVVEGDALQAAGAWTHCCQKILSTNQICCRRGEGISTHCRRPRSGTASRSQPA